MAESAFENLTAAVTTINAPMPTGIDERTLLACLRGEISEGKWRVYVQALFDEVDVSVIHNLVVDHLVTFDDLLKALDTWQVAGSENERWIREMASFAMEGSHAEGAGRPRQP
jgi:subtilisin-like proprotein convertase family protein